MIKECKTANIPEYCYLKDIIPDSPNLLRGIKDLSKHLIVQ
jgi:hypothetical protein